MCEIIFTLQRLVYDEKCRQICVTTVATNFWNALPTGRIPKPSSTPSRSSSTHRFASRRASARPSPTPSDAFAPRASKRRSPPRWSIQEEPPLEKVAIIMIEDVFSIFFFKAYTSSIKFAVHRFCLSVSFFLLFVCCVDFICCFIFGDFEEKREMDRLYSECK